MNKTILLCLLSFFAGIPIVYFVFVHHSIVLENTSNGTVYSDLFVCPNQCENVIISLIKNAHKRIYCEMYHIDYDKYVNALIDAKKRGVDVKLIVDKQNIKCDSYYCKYYKKAIEKLKENGIAVRYSDNFNLLHSKSCLFDNMLFVGSHNFTPTSAKRNREINILTNSTKVIDEFLSVFNRDYNSAKTV